MKEIAIKWYFTTITTDLAISLANLPFSIRVQTTLLLSICHATPFSARALRKNISLISWYRGKKQIDCGLVWSVLLSTTIRVITVVKMLWTHETRHHSGQNVVDSRDTFSVVCNLIENDTRHRSGQNLLWIHSAVSRESTRFLPLWWRVS